MGRGWRVIPHTSEVGLEIRGRSWPDFYRSAASGLLSLYSIRPKGSPVETSVAVDGAGPEETLVAWLNEIVFHVSTRRLFPQRIGLFRCGPKGMRASLKSVPLGAAQPALEIKSATYHDLEVRRLRGTWTARVIIDV